MWSCADAGDRSTNTSIAQLKSPRDSAEKSRGAKWSPLLIALKTQVRPHVGSRTALRSKLLFPQRDHRRKLQTRKKRSATRPYRCSLRQHVRQDEIIGRCLTCSDRFAKRPDSRLQHEVLPRRKSTCRRANLVVLQRGQTGACTAPRD